MAPGGDVAFGNRVGAFPTERRVRLIIEVLVCEVRCNLAQQCEKQTYSRYPHGTRVPWASKTTATATPAIETGRVRGRITLSRLLSRYSAYLANYHTVHKGMVGVSVHISVFGSEVDSETVLAFGKHHLHSR